MNVVNSEKEVRLVLLIIVGALLWAQGNEWMAVLLGVSLLPWNPVYPILRLLVRLGGWAAQPVADQVIARKSRKTGRRTRETELVPDLSR